MKRFHVHVHVNDLEKNIAFYSALFDTQPARQESDYAKWMLDDPPVNFAISTRGLAKGVDHLGIQVDDSESLNQLRERAKKADLAMLDSGEATCCYARSDKYWLTDPQGIAWEQYHTLEGIPVFSIESSEERVSDAACCPQVQGKQIAAQPASCAVGARQGCC